MSTESKELAAKANGFDSKKAFDLLLNNALYILMIIAVIVIQVINPNFLKPSSLINISPRRRPICPWPWGSPAVSC